MQQSETWNDWSAPLNVNDVGKITLLSWGPQEIKHIQVDTYLESKTKILFLSFTEETQGQLDSSNQDASQVRHPSYLIHNDMKDHLLEYH